MPEEQWKLIAGFPNYAVSDQGRWMNLRKDRIMSAYPGARGELRVVLYRNSVGHYWALHRLVASIFLPDWDPSRQVKHIDGDKTNCAASNLRMSEIGAH